MKVTRKELRQLVEGKRWKEVENADVSEITDMRCIFESSKFNGDLSKWNVSKVTNMSYMLDHCPLESNPPQWYRN